jgi:leader peptidase (prepilin peptidase)/N-methyltransferase
VSGDVTFVILTGLVGLLVGSFLNVCIYRLPRRESVVGGRSRCPSCGRQIRAWENVPIVSWLALRGRCAGCRAPISIRYPIVELVTGAVFATGAAVFGPSWLLMSRLTFAAAMIVLFAIDLEHRILPNVITLPGIVAGLLSSALLPPGLVSALLGAMVCGLALWGMGELVSRVLGKDALGFGDVKMIAMMGAFLGWQQTLVSLFLASLLGSVVGLAIILVTRNRDYQIPLGSFLAVGGLIAAVAGEPIVAWYAGEILRL